MDIQEHNKIKYLVALISDFSAKYNLNEKQAFNYLNRFKGLDFFNQHYNTMHTQSFEDSIEDLTLVCKKHGGRIE